ncbi:hypothetical protein Bca52824_068294 [Brassica carinata]|uniref:DM2 domain-containing protein n=1 Tax=Brassica carinata TaxID=52824 RepID=A0A8X7Q0H4_BRACI|nr:hypothetical protein Bca52824_068294 [Brassica carinata]
MRLYLMDSSDEEGQILPDYVDEYSFVDQSDIPVKFSILPAKWDDDEEEEEDPRLPVYLRGSTDCGNESVCKLAKAWRFDLSDERLKVQVFLHGMRWITLHKPAKSYEALVRTTLVTLQCLHFVKMNPEASSDRVWRSLEKWMAMKMDQDLTKSKCLRKFLEKTFQTTPTEVDLPTQHQEDAQLPQEQNFTADNMLDEESSSDDDSEMNLQFDTVCSICDNGGYILCCEGSCLRAFHPTIADGVDTSCESLGFPSGTEIHSLREYLCNNCLHKQHQCYACANWDLLMKTPLKRSSLVLPQIAVISIIQYVLQSFSMMVIKSKQKNFKPRFLLEILFSVLYTYAKRCPTAYHRKCLPRQITSELNCDEETPQRTWEKLLPYNRILIYCLNHEIVGNLATPARDHLVFPDVSGPRRTLSHGLEPVKEDVPSMVTGSKYQEGVNRSRKPRMNFSVNDYLIKRRAESGGKRVSKEEGSPDFADPNDVDDEDVESRVLSIIDEVESSFSFDEFVKSRGESHVQCYNSRNDIGKNITTGLVETHVNAARAALKMFEAGRNEDAKAIFDPDLLVQLMKHKTKLEIYLSPFLHGMRYTSFGRHFTKLEKLEEIVERLHSYVQNGDTIVDFCCGSNDLSCLMKAKLEKTGKTCFFKNFDLILPKNTFNFEKRDWLTVKKEELPDGSRLIMGLNPPFGFKSSLANTFIQKALEFKPKILILIVPSETKRVDAIAEYDLIWEDTNLLSGKSFYLPGSIDVNNKTIEQWNNIPPPLYLWSRRDWTWNHKAIALQQGHITHMYHSTYTVGLHHAEPPPDDGIVQEMEISPLD